MSLRLEDIPAAPVSPEQATVELAAEQHGEVRQAASEGTAGTSLRDSLRAAYEALPASRTETFDVPGWKGLLVMRLRRVEPEELVALRKGLPDVDLKDEVSLTSAQMAMNADFLVLATEEVLGRKGGELQSLGDDDRPLRFDMDLARYLNLQDVDPEQGARGVLLRVFDDNKLAVKMVADKADEWMSGAREDREGRFLGK